MRPDLSQEQIRCYAVMKTVLLETELYLINLIFNMNVMNSNKV